MPTPPNPPPRPAPRSHPAALVKTTFALRPLESVVVASRRQFLLTARDRVLIIGRLIQVPGGRGAKGCRRECVCTCMWKGVRERGRLEVVFA